MIFNAIAEKLKRTSRDDFKGRHFEAWLIIQAVSWYLRYPLSYRNIEDMFLERGFEVDHSTLNRWTLAYAPLIEKRLRFFRKPPCGSIRIDETYVKIRGQWRYLYRAIDKHGNPIDFLLTAHRDLAAAKRFFRKMLKDEPLFSPDSIATDGAKTFPSAINAAEKEGLLRKNPTHTSPKTCSKALKATISGSSRPCRRSVASNPFTPPGEPSKGSKPCCGCARASASLSGGARSSVFQLLSLSFVAPIAGPLFSSGSAHGP